MALKFLRAAGFYRLAFVICLLLELLPVWSFQYVASADGPSHLFNSYVFLNYDRVAVFRDAFTVQIPPAGNLMGHGFVMALMQFAVPPEIAEKLVMTVCVVGLAIAFWYAVSAIRTAHPAAPLLVFPFLYNWPMQMGFWSFSLGVPLLLVCVGLCLRHRGNWNLRSLSLLFLTAGAVYMCHPLTWAVCGLVVALMVVVSEYRNLLNPVTRTQSLWQTVLPIVMFVPFGIPTFLFARESTLLVFDPITSFAAWIWPVYTINAVRLVAADIRPARLLFLLLVVATIANLAWRRRQKFSYADVLLPAAVLLFLLALVSPSRIGEGTFIQVRFVLFGFLALSTWLAVTLPKRLIYVMAALAVLMTAWMTLERIPAWKRADVDLATVARFGNDVAPNSFVCQIAEQPQSESVSAVDHGIDLWMPQHVVDVLDYEAARKAFWTRFRPGYYLDEDFLKPASRASFEGALKRFEQRTGKRLDYILITNSKAMAEPALQALMPHLWPEYQLIESGPSNIYLYRHRREDR